MPRYAITTFLNKKQQAKLEKARNKLGWSRYKFLQKSIMAYIEAVEKEKIEIDRGKQETERELDSGIETRGQRTLEVSY